jgi:hypothetical protein
LAGVGHRLRGIGQRLGGAQVVLVRPLGDSAPALRDAGRVSDLPRL